MIFALRNANIYSGYLVERYNEYLKNKPVHEGLKWALDYIGKNSENKRLVQVHGMNGGFLDLLKDSTDISKFEQVIVYEYRKRFFNLIEAKPKNIKKFFLDPLTDPKFKQMSVDYLVSTDHLNNERDPVKWINDLLSKFNAKNVFISFEIAKEDNGQDLSEDNINVEILFRGGKYIYNLYNENALKEIASQTGLELKIIRDYDGDSAILYRLEKEAEKPKSEPVEEKEEVSVEEPPKEKPKKRRKPKKDD